MQDNGDAETNSGINSKLYFHYGADGVTGFTYRKNKTTFQDYFYKKNAQGDIIGIYDQTGKEVVRYYYDAWGNQKAYYTITTSWYEVKETDTYTNAVVARINPFRYRGYYYDEETKLYYLNSRYYDPETGRFINADDISYIDENTINGLNLFAYCNNKPIMFTDYNGNFAIGLFIIFGLLIAGTVTGGAILGKKSYNEGNRGWDLAKDIIVGSSIGLAASGFILMLGSIGVGIAFEITTQILGVTSLQAFAIGALAFDFTAMFISPIFDFEMQPVEFEESNSNNYDTSPSYKFPNIDSMGLKTLSLYSSILNSIGVNRWKKINTLNLRVNYQEKTKRYLL